jgi:UDP-N-acetylglucosamine 2-epimerase (non-hydrolysing)
MRVVHVVDATPNSLNVWPAFRALSARGVTGVVVRTNDDGGSPSAPFSDPSAPREQELAVDVGRGSAAQRTALTMQRLEPILTQERPDLVVVAGETSSILAAAIVCAKGHFPVAHVDAGRRSFDKTAPEEINRVLTDRLADLLFATSRDAETNLRNEGIAPGKIHLVEAPLSDEGAGEKIAVVVLDWGASG